MTTRTVIGVGNGGRVFTFAVFTEAVSLMPTDRLSSTLKQI
jgi:hypothetical protein